MDTVITETGVTLDTRLLCENIIILTFEVANDFTEARSSSAVVRLAYHQGPPYLASLSIWSPNPGVSTIVKEMRVPSSSNSNSTIPLVSLLSGQEDLSEIRTNGDGLDLDAFLEVCIGRIISILSLEDLLPAEGVHKCSSS
jgi:hypothetical protein